MAALELLVNTLLRGTALFPNIAAIAASASFLIGGDKVVVAVVVVVVSVVVGDFGSEGGGDVGLSSFSGAVALLRDFVLAIGDQYQLLLDISVL